MPRLILLRHACLPEMKKAAYVNGTEGAGRRRSRTDHPPKCSDRR
ncbi:hypothetical protein ppKF707_3693 [Metapseudomonas furukawaii]|uniref:Uncharacterized protein n=1 Tax=Metapseudomonas furukawaii TaxID=1149133 RepID=A0AAD1BYA0_METFU|nr:hypothetical protein ppKF707_3693 [Pseudomonas furukawaii]BAU73478.1 hypothetical protein KF707C_17900 [Pseudomonas furukawaii]